MAIDLVKTKPKIKTNRFLYVDIRVIFRLDKVNYALYLLER